MRYTPTRRSSTIPESNSLSPKLWRQYASSRVHESDEISLSKLKFLKDDPHRTLRAMVGGVVLRASETPQAWLPNARIQAVCYDGRRMDGNRQLDAQDISGPRGFAEYSERAVFEAVVNAVVRRDYAVRGSKIGVCTYSTTDSISTQGSFINVLCAAPGFHGPRRARPLA